jgi:hypothetical protein
LKSEGQIMFCRILFQLLACWRTKCNSRPFVIATNIDLLFCYLLFIDRIMVQGLDQIHHVIKGMLMHLTYDNVVDNAHFRMNYLTGQKLKLEK